MFKLMQKLMEEERRQRESGRKAPAGDLKTNLRAFSEEYGAASDEEREVLHDGVTELLSMFLSDDTVDSMARNKQRQNRIKESLFSDSSSTRKAAESGEIGKAKRRAEKLAKLPELEEQLRRLGMPEIEIGKIIERTRIEIMDSE